MLLILNMPPLTLTGEDGGEGDKSNHPHPSPLPQGEKEFLSHPLSRQRVLQPESGDRHQRDLVLCPLRPAR